MGPTEELVIRIWAASLVLFLVVGVVVFVLLRQILRTARGIRDGAAAIWTAGKGVAANTVHIPMLLTTNRVAAAIHDEAGAILRAAARIRAHAESCPGCPQCVLGGGSR